MQLTTDGHRPYLDVVERAFCRNVDYLDPPFNSNRDYNVIFRDESGNATDAQLLAFEDHLGVGAGDGRRRL